ncbi:MAG: S8 family serine peptidase [candidate division KSB1 bacterium]|nr:S8 family serine peptidase [candidate division KSB1 bacterium]
MKSSSSNLWTGWLFAVLLALAGAASNAEAAGGPAPLPPGWGHVPGRVMIKLKHGHKSMATLQAIMHAYGATAATPAFSNVKNRSLAQRADIGLDRIFTLLVPEPSDVMQLAARLNRHPAVEYAEPVYLIPLDVAGEPQPVAAPLSAPLLIPNDPHYSQQQHLPQIKAPEAWEVAKGSSDVIVAIIDTGTDWNHPDLVDNIWSNVDEALDGIDNDGNGFVDDIRGWDFVDNITDVANGEDGDTPDNDPMDFNGHGTHTSGLAAAVTDNGIGVAAISWNVTVMPLRIGWQNTSGQGLGRSDWMAQAFIYAADNGAHVASLSYGNSEIVVDGARYAFENGVVVVCSAGNGDSEAGNPLPLAPFALSVAALTEQDRKASYSSYGDWVKVSAPGGDQPGGRIGILSTVFNDGYAFYSGTSMAAPLTAGLAAVIKSQHPNWTPSQVILQVAETADDIDALNPRYLGKLGTGRINTLRALGETVTALPRIRLAASTTSDIIGGNGNGMLEAGETASLVVTLENNWGYATNLRGTLTSRDWAVTVTKASANYGSLAGLSNLNQNTKANTADPFTIAILPDAFPHRALLTLELNADNGYHDSLELTLGISPSILVVDDDDGNNNVESYYTRVLDSLGLGFEMHDHVRHGTPAFEKMKGYATVIWLCEWQFPALDSTDRAELGKYLDAGGSLFISGQDIGWDLCDQNHAGSTNEFDRSGGQSLTFYESRLHARYLADDSDFSSLTGVSGDPIGDGLRFDVFQPGRLASQQFPSEIEALAPAVSIFNYGNGRSGAVRYAGDYRVVNFAFGGYEAIVDSLVREQVMLRVVNWLNGFVFEHEPLRDTEDFVQPRSVTARITSTLSPLQEVVLYWDVDGAFPFNKVVMSPDAEGNYRGEIPAQSNKTVEYFILARTQKGFSAPFQIYSYRSAADHTPPVLTNLTTLHNVIDNAGPFAVTVEVSDNLGVNADRVWLHYRTSSGLRDSTKLAAGGGSAFTGALSGGFAYGDTVSYYVSAYDVAAAANRGVTPEKSFIVGMEDFENGLHAWQVEPNRWGLTRQRRADGLWAASSNPGTLYAVNVNSAMTLNLPLDFSKLSAATLYFSEQHYFSANQEDFGVVEISADGGQNWAQLTDQFRGTQAQWRERGFSMNAYTGAGFNNVRIRFRIQTDGNPAAASAGWFVDRVRIVAGVTVAVNDREASSPIPVDFTLGQSYPNPFAHNLSSISGNAAQATIAYSLPQSAVVKLMIYDVLGHQVATLVSGPQPAGTHFATWNGRDALGRPVASGIYFYRMEAITAQGGREFRAVRRLLVLQ